MARMAEQGYEEVAMFHDAETGLKAVIAIHSTFRGPALGGTRMWTYACEEDAIDDAMFLARGMSYKSAAADLPLGGGKGVIIGDPCNDKCEELFRAYGRCVEKMNGRFITAADMGTEEHDLDCVRMETDYVVGGSALGSPSPYTAYGVWKGLKACASEVYGTPSLKGLTVAIQGVGSVGYALCKHLVDEGAKLIVTDIDTKRLQHAVDTLGATAVAPDEIYSQQCDIFAPCGGGGVINSKTLPELKCKIVGGAANNVIKDPKYGPELQERGILYAPDYIINGGGIIFVEYSRQGNKDTEFIKSEIDRIEGRLTEIFKRSREENIIPEDAADRYAEDKLREKVVN
jgi:leucine dehydrogenase